MTKARILADYVAGGTTAAEFDYMDGVTSNVQTQLDAKAPLASPTFTGAFTSPGIDDNANAIAMTIDSSERVGINTADGSATSLLTITQNADTSAIDIYGYDDMSSKKGSLCVNDVGYTQLRSHSDRGMDFKSGETSASQFRWFADDTQKMTLDASGKLLLGKTAVGAAEGLQFEGGGLVYAICSGARPAIFGRNDSDGTLVECLRSGSTVGSISVTTSSTAYNTSSDYRLKENVVPMSGSIDRLKTLKPSRFNFIADADTTVDGFIAHEASEVVPEAVIGEKDEMTEAVLYTESDELPEGKKIGDIKKESEPLMQGIDQSKLVPLLVGALQEAVIKIETLETENTALKTRMDALEARVTALEPADE